MSDRNAALQGAFPCLAPLILAMALACPAQAQDCTPLTANFVLCAAGTPWDGAERIEQRAGSALAREPYWLEFTEDWPDRQEGQDIHAASAAEAAHWAEIVAGMGDSVTFAALADDRAETAHLRVARLIFAIQVMDDPPLGIAVIHAEGAGAMIRLQLTIEEETDPQALDAAAQELVRLVRPAAGG